MVRHWRPWLIVLHRDIGFFCLGLTLVYGLSGFAANHRRRWDPDRSHSVTTSHVGAVTELLADALTPERRTALAADPGAISPDEEQQLVPRLAAKLGRKPPRDSFWRGPDQLTLSFASGERDLVDYSPRTGEARATRVRDRFLLRDLNFLHRNEGSSFWTFIADGYAIALVFLGLSGILMVKGRHGLCGRGGLLVALGVALPFIALFLLRYR